MKCPMRRVYGPKKFSVGDSVLVSAKDIHEIGSVMPRRGGRIMRVNAAGEVVGLQGQTTSAPERDVWGRYWVNLTSGRRVVIAHESEMMLA